MALVRDGRLYLRTNRGPEITSIIPDARVTGDVVSVPHTIDAFMVLRNLGAKLTGLEPIQQGWTWPKKSGVDALYPFQKQTAAFLTVNPRAYCLHAPRMGKTASAGAAMLYLRDVAMIDCVLVVCPIAAVGDWQRELFSLRPNDSPLFLHGSRRDSLDDPKVTNKIFIINPDGLRAIEKNITAHVTSKRIGLVIFDELTEFQNAKSKRWRAARRMSESCRFVWGLTGTPGSPLQVHGQVRLVNPVAACPASVTYWRDMTYTNPYAFKYVEKSTATALVRSVMQPAIRFEKSEVMTVPHPQVEFIEVDMTPAQTKMYEVIRREQYTVAEGKKITAVNAGVVISKLLQVSAGAVRTDDGEIHTLDITPRIDQLEHLLLHKSSAGKMVVFAPFKATLLQLRDLLYERGITSDVINGDTKQQDRVDIVRAFTDTNTPQILLAHPIVARYSLELSVADTIVFCGPVLSGSFSYTQCANRIQSVQQKSSTPALVHLYSSKAELTMHNAVRNNADMNATLLNLFHTEVQRSGV